MFALGFGQSEVNTARQIIDECREAIDADLDNMGDALGKVELKYSELDDKYDEMPTEKAPERYTRFWANSHYIYRGKYIVEFTMQHVNRRHALAPDSWAMMRTHWILSVCTVGGTKVFREV